MPRTPSGGAGKNRSGWLRWSTIRNTRQWCLGRPSTTTCSSAKQYRTPNRIRTEWRFVFPGQGAQHVGMARGLHDCEPVFAEHFDACAAAFGDEMGFDLRAEVFDGAGRNLERTDRAQPALFAVEYALAKLVESYGVRASVLAGHSIGEYVAATIAGVFDLPTAVKAVSMRARLMHASARGVMVAVALSPEAIAEYLGSDVDLAAVNDPGSCVVAGSEESIRDFQARLAESGIVARRVRTSHAFHSRLMDPGDSGVQRLHVPADTSRTSDPVAVEHHRSIDVRWRGDQSRDVGASDSGNRSVLRRTRRAAHGSDPRPGRGRSRRCTDRLGGAPPEVVGQTPRRSPHAASGPEQERPRHVPAGTRAVVVGGHRRRLDAAD